MCIAFLVGEVALGLKIGCVREIIINKEVSSAPGFPPFIKGLINRRGEIIPICDLRKLFLLDDEGLSSERYIIIVESAQNKYGLLADEILGSISYTPEGDSSAFEDDLEGVLARLRPIVSTFLKSGGRTVFLIDESALVGRLKGGG